MERTGKPAMVGKPGRVLLGLVIACSLFAGCNSLDENPSDPEAEKFGILDVLKGTEYGGVSSEARDIERSLSRTRVE